MGLKYYTRYRDFNDKIREIRFIREGFDGEPTEWINDIGAVKYSAGSSDAFFPDQPIIAKQAHIGLIFKERYDLTDFVTNRQTYFVEIVDVETDKVNWSGWLEPWDASHSYQKPPYQVNMTASCGLAHLSRKKYVNPSNTFKKTGLQIIQDCLGIIHRGDLPIRLSAHMLENGFTGDDRLGLTSFEENTFRYYDDNGEAMYCDVIVNNILNHFNAEIVQMRNVWVIRAIVDNATGADTRFYDIGDASGIAEWPLTYEINSEHAKSLTGGNIRALAPINKYRTEIDFGQQRPFFENGNMLLWTEDGLVGWDFSHMPKGNPGWERYEVGAETSRGVLKINGKTTEPYKRKKKKKFWQVAIPILTGMIGANLKNEHEYIEPSEWIESSAGPISRADRSVNISFNYETEAFSPDILISIRIPTIDAKGNVKNFWVDPSSEPALAGADKSKASATEKFCFIRIPPVDMGALTDKGTIDVSSNPPYPAANYSPGSKDQNWTWKVTGVPPSEYRRIGGVNGVLVENGDLIIARVPNLGGSQEAVGGFWEVVSVRNNTKKGTFELGVSLSTTFITKAGQPYPADKIYVRFYKLDGWNDGSFSGNWYKIYNLDGKLEGFVASDESAKYATTLERGDVTDEEAATIQLISGDYTPWYVGTWTRPDSNTPTSSWRRRPALSESMSIYRAMMRDRLSMTTKSLIVFDGKITLLPGQPDIDYLHRLYFVDQDKHFRIVRFSFVDSTRQADITAVEIRYEEIPDSELTQNSYIPGSRQLNTVPGQGDGVYPSKQDSTNGRLVAEDMPLTDEELEEQMSTNGRLAAIFEDVPALVFTLGEMATKGVDLSDYLSATLLYKLETDEGEQEIFDMTDLVFKVKSKPTWVTQAVEDDLFIAVTGKPAAIGTYQVVFEVSDGTDAKAEKILDDEGNVIPTVPFTTDVVIPIVVYPKPTIKYYLYDTTIGEKLLGEIVQGAGFKKPASWKVKVNYTGFHEAYFASMNGPGLSSNVTPYPYLPIDPTGTNDYVYNLPAWGSYISAVGTQTMEFATFRNEGDPDAYAQIRRDRIKFVLYDEEYINKVKFELWGAVSGTLIGPINSNGLSAFVVTEPWDVKMIIDGVEHDAGDSVLGSEVGDLDTMVIGPLDPAVEDANYFQLGEPRPEFDPSTYNVVLTLNLEGEEQYNRMATFTINKKKVQPTAGKIKLGTIPLNTTNFELIAELGLTGNSFASLPVPNWALMVNDESEEFDADEWELFQFKAGYLVSIDIAARTGEPQTHPYGEVLTQAESHAFGDLSSVDIGDIYQIPSTFRAIYRRRLAGTVVKLYQADFSFGPLVEIPDGTEVGGAGSGTGVTEIYAGRGLSEIVDDYIKTFNVNTDGVTLEIFDQTNPAVNWLRIKDKGVTFAKMQDIASLSLIGKLTAGSGSPYEVPVLNGASGTAASDTTIGTTLWVKNQLTGAVSGLAGRVAKFATNTTLTYSILEESGISLIARQGIFVADNVSNTNVRGFAVQEGGSTRFSFGKLGAGADFAFWRFADNGATVLGTPIGIERATGKVTLETQLTIQGASLPPLVVSSTALVTNFNADLLDGQHGAYYLARANHTGTQLASTISNFSSAVLATTLAGLSTSNSAITSSDTILQAFGKIQGQITGNISGTVGRLAKFTGTNAIGISILEESGIALTAREGIFVSDHTSNTNVRGFVVQEGGSTRFSFGKLGAGADFAFWRYADNGATVLGTPIGIERATGKVTLETQLTINASGIAPLVVGSSVLVTNLNADLLDGQHGSYYLNWDNFTNIKSVLAGNGMTGGGALTSNVTLTLGTPSTLDASTSNSVSGSTHTHAITTGNLVAGSNVSLSGTITNRLIGSGNVTIAAVSMPWSGVTGTPTTLSGFGIVDAPTTVYVDTQLGGKENTFSKGNLIQGSGISLSGTLTNRLVGSGDVTISISGGLSGSGTNGYFAKWTGSTSLGISVMQDTGSEINIGNTRSLGVEGPAAMRDYLHVWGYCNMGTSSNHGTLLIHQANSGTIHGSAAFEIRSTSKALLLPRMTYAQKNAIPYTPGLIVYQTDSQTDSAGGTAGVGYYLSYPLLGGWARVAVDYIQPA